MSAFLFKCTIIILALTLVASASHLAFASESMKNGEWQEFDYKEIPQFSSWYGEVEDTIKKTSRTGRGPLWAKMATSITAYNSEDNEKVVGLKIKL